MDVAFLNQRRQCDFCLDTAYSDGVFVSLLNFMLIGEEIYWNSFKSAANIA
jgi:hypothetical protein